MNKRNFFSVFYSVCTGTSIFKELANYGVIRAVWHLFIACVLISLAYSFATFKQIENKISSGAAFMEKNFGNILVEKDGIFPSKDRDTMRTEEYSYMKVDYLPEQSQLADYKFSPGASYSGFIWTPSKVIGWMKLNATQYVVYPAVASQYDTRFISMYPADKMNNYIKFSDKIDNFSNLLLRVFIQDETPVVGIALLDNSTSFDSMVVSFSKWSAFIVFLKFFISTFFNVLFYSLIFGAIYAFTERSGALNFRFKNFFIIAVYASFPAIAIGTIFTAVQTQYLEYSTVFIIVFVIYLFVIMNKLKLGMKPDSNKLN